MENDFVNYIEKVLPVELNASAPEPSGKLAAMVFEKEISADAFPAEDFRSIRQRAAMCIPYQVPTAMLGRREHALDVIELCMLNHRKTNHNESIHDGRIAELTAQDFTPEETAIITRDFWNG